MTESATHPAEEPSSLFHLPRSWWWAMIVAIVMVLLALLGVGISTTTSAGTAATYWISLIPIYAALCIATAWGRAHRIHTAEPVRSMVSRQAFHWLGIAVALGLDFFVRGTGQETGTATGMTALLLLALGCYLAGVHLEWLFIIVGILLSLTLLVVDKAEQYLWVILAVGGLTVLLLFFLGWLFDRPKTHRTPADPTGS